jgi:hypothetical protein
MKGSGSSLALKVFEHEIYGAELEAAIKVSVNKPCEPVWDSTM